ncbi:MAG TPA: TlpA disulfide reductase family protein [Bryobacteraceae bacterium]|nr:TlpA disulfide reductase family protein [Bryobacteraceae bacterium]
MKRLLALAATVACLASAQSIPPDSPRKAPELAFTVPGQGQKLLSQYHGKVVAVEFIFTTCPHCQAATKIMEKFQKEFGPRGFQAIDVAVNDNADLLVENFAKDFQVNFPVGWVLRDQFISFMGWTNAYYVVPQQVMIDRKGMIRYQTPQKEDSNWDSIMKEDNVRQHIEELLGSGTPSARANTGPTHVAFAKK